MQSLYKAPQTGGEGSIPLSHTILDPMSANNHLMIISINYANYRLSNSLSFKKETGIKLLYF